MQVLSVAIVLFLVFATTVTAVSGSYCPFCDLVDCRYVSKEECEADGKGHFVDVNTSQEICRCCAECIPKENYCKECEVTDCRNVRYDECQNKQDKFQPPSFNNILGCRCCSTCQCCEFCTRSRCAGADEQICKNMNGTYLERNTECGSKCRCCPGCQLTAGLNEDCSNKGLESLYGFSRECKSGLQCRDGTCIPL